ncbi:S-adenosyl-L-methionine-dependent methyltransferase [Podospora aff. communis PSN243]|uniref:S-adenosyl-L-methionine-dependent methyltransferase n=1 Tax=Podospora aff. communis PSN243 TaxID=3040156 RepID=A0AAV9GEQ7_9PEZI|nr:S-adenosyl-L-methionine-dependent methyltransferase [Podospora aff. communis PSN243]
MSRNQSPNVQAITRLLEELKDRVETLDAPDRRVAVASARKVFSALEDPEEVAFAQIFQSPIYNFAIRMGVELGIFRKLVNRNGASVTAADLAAECKAEELLLVRIMRVLTAIGYASEAGEREYAASSLSKAMVVPYIEAFAVHTGEHGARAAIRAPEYFKLHGYTSPVDGRDCPLQFALETDLHFFDWIHKDPEKAKRFNVCMTGNKLRRREWFEWYPVAERLLQLFEFRDSSDSAFLVDMGGGKGRHLQALMGKFPSVKNHLVLQDLPGTISSLENLSPGIHPMPHDIFSPQPVVGALVYYTHFVLHDFTDDRCRVFLQAVASAMRPGYSRLLMNEAVIPERGCPPFFAVGDITMMLVLAGIQRSKRHWIELVESAGLRVVNVWESPDAGDMEGVIEAEVAS